MLIPELIKNAVAGSLRFEFIESSVSIMQECSLSSLKGHGWSEPSADYFHFHFLPRAAFTPAQREKLEHRDGRQFHLVGTERGSASWTGVASELRIIDGPRGNAVHAYVPEWTREDARSVHAAFLRVVVAGRHPYPVHVRHDGGLDARMASAVCGAMKIDIRDYGTHTEICTSDIRPIPAEFADHMVDVLGAMLGRQLQWVYRERHAEGRRRISVRASDVAARTSDDRGTVAGSYDNFWQEYGLALAAELRA